MPTGTAQRARTLHARATGLGRDRAARADTPSLWRGEMGTREGLGGGAETLGADGSFGDANGQQRVGGSFDESGGAADIA